MAAVGALGNYRELNCRPPFALGADPPLRDQRHEHAYENTKHQGLQRFAFHRHAPGHGRIALITLRWRFHRHGETLTKSPTPDACHAGQGLSVLVNKNISLRPLRPVRRTLTQVIPVLGPGFSKPSPGWYINRVTFALLNCQESLRRVSEWLAATLEMWCPERGCGFESRALR